MAPMEMSVAMKRIIFLLTLLLAVPAFSAGQTQSREQKSNDSQTPRTRSTAVRDRVVGSNRANHAERQKANDNSQLVADPAPNSSTPVNQKSAEPKWGNTAVVNRPGPNERIAP